MRVFVFFVFIAMSLNLFSQMTSNTNSGFHFGVGNCPACLEIDLATECLINNGGHITIPFYIQFNTDINIPNNINFEIYNFDTQNIIGASVLDSPSTDLIESSNNDCNFYTHYFEIDVDVKTNCIADINSTFPYPSELLNIYGIFTVNGNHITSVRPDLFDPSCYENENGQLLNHLHSETNIFPIPICCILPIGSGNGDKTHIENKISLNNSNLEAYEKKELKAKENESNSFNISYKKNNTLEVFPNPTSQYLNLAIELKNNYDIFNIYNISGDLVLKSSIESRINISQFQAGIYFIRFNAKDNEKSITYKFQKI